MSYRRNLWAMVLVLLVAFGLRLYRLADLPPGLFHDEAYNTLDAQALAEGLPHPRFYDGWELYARAIHTSWPPPATRFPVFLEGNYGREPLFHYLGGLVVALVGAQVWALRLVAAWSGTCAVLTAYLVTRELFSEEPGRAARRALLAAGVATGVYSLLAFSRLALRIITLAPLEGLAVALWWRVGREGRRRWWALAGLLLGLAQYTYVPARLLPLVVACPVLIWIARRPQRRSDLVRGAGLGLLVALAVTMPLAVFFARYPAYLTLRAKDVAAVAPERGLVTMVANVGRVFRGLIWRGDTDVVLNLPGRPVLDGVQAVFFGVGAIACLRDRGLTGWFLLLWAGVMHLPSVVSGVAPTFGRSIGGLLPVVMVVAVGIETVWTAVVARWPRLSPWVTLAFVGVLALSVGLTARDYFAVWAELPELPPAFHHELAAVGRYVRRLPAEAVVYLTPPQENRATLLLAVGDREPPRDFYGPAGLLPAGDPEREAIYLLLEEDETTADVLETLLPSGRWNARNPIFAAYHVPPSIDRVRPQHAARADFAALIRLIGFDLLSTDLRPGGTLSVRLVWRAQAEMKRRYTAFVHLLGPANPATGSPLWAQDDHEPGQGTYSTDRWFAGELVVDTFHLQIPTSAPAGVYTLSTGFYDRETLERLPRSDDVGDTATMTTVSMTND